MKVKVIYPLLEKLEADEIECDTWDVANGALLLWGKDGLIQAFAPGQWFRAWEVQE
jgi:hypothetical protein